MTVTKEFDDQSHVIKYATKHSAACYKKDLEKIVDQLHAKTGVFEHRKGRMHRTFTKVDEHITAKL